MPIRYRVTHLLSYPTRTSATNGAQNPLSGDGTRDSTLKSVLFESRLYQFPITFAKNVTFPIFLAYPFEIKWARQIGYCMNAAPTQLHDNLKGHFVLEEKGRKLSWACAGDAAEGAAQFVFEILYVV